MLVVARKLGVLVKVQEVTPGPKLVSSRRRCVLTVGAPTTPTTPFAPMLRSNSLGSDESLNDEPRNNREGARFNRGLWILS